MSPRSSKVTAELAEHAKTGWLSGLCVLCGCLLSAGSLMGCGRPAAPSFRPNVLLVTIDTMRADRLGVGVAPTLDRLAEASVRFTAARTAAPLTLPSHTTILTGLLPPQHGVRENGIDELDSKHATLGALLKDAGYSTAAFVGAFVLDRRFGLARGFDVYDDHIPRDPNATERLEAERPATVVVDRALAWLNAWNAERQTRTSNDERRTRTPNDERRTTNAERRTTNDRPFFLWIHVYDPHAPYDPPPGVAVHTQSRYDAEIAYADSQLARVFAWLPAVGLLDRTLIVVAGDHGEGLGDHGEQTHGMLLYDSTLRVPLFVAAPGVKAAQRSDAVSLVDVAPTILRAAGLTQPLEMHGRDLLGEIRPKPDLYGETEYPRVAGWAPLQALTDGRWKTIRAGAATEVYDLQSDPTEQHDLASSHPNVVAAMAARIAALRAADAAPAARRISPEADERLRSLGYVASTAQPTAEPGAPNPASTIAEWNRFEDALSKLNARRGDALGELAALAKQNPSAPVFVATYARALKEAGQQERSLAVYREAARRWPTDAQLLHDLAVAARDASAHASAQAAARLREEASKAEQAAIAIAPSTATAHNGLGLIAIDEDRPKDAEVAFQRATEIDPTNATYWVNLGNARRAMGDRTGAEQAYRRALDVDALSLDAANGLGVLLVEAKRSTEAIPWLERAAAAPEFVEARLNLGIALQEAGQTARAAETYRSILAAPAKYTREREAAAKLLASLGAAR